MSTPPSNRRELANCIRALAMDAVQKAESGHPGTPMALAPLAYRLFTKHMRHDPADPNWVPLANTANDPTYPGAHAAFSQAAATVLQDVFGTDVFSFSLTNSTVAITRSFSGFSQAADEASDSRIFAGQHFRSDEEAGQTLGGRVADFVVDHAFQTRS